MQRLLALNPDGSQAADARLGVHPLGVITLPNTGAYVIALPPGYRRIDLEFCSVYSTGSGELRLRFSSDGGSTFWGSGKYVACQDQTGVYNPRRASLGYLYASYATNTGADKGLSGPMELRWYDSPSVCTMMHSRLFERVWNDNTLGSLINSGGQLVETDAVDAVELSFYPGNIGGGSIELFGHV